MHPIIKNSLIAFGTITIASGAVIGLLKISNAFLPLVTYLGTRKVANEEQYVVCPQLEKVPGPSGSYLIKDTCTNTYWMAHDLPVLSDNADKLGYTWQEAKDACEGVATIGTGANKRSLFRLPTTDELYALVNIDANGSLVCNDTNPSEAGKGCASIARIGSTMKDGGGTAPLNGNQNMTMYATSTTTPAETRVFADGAYWSANTLQADEYRAGAVAGGSVNLRYGTVNNPVYSKNIRLNVRCIANNVGAGDVQTVTTVSTVPGDIAVNSVRWWESKDVTGGGKVYSMAYVKNWTPQNQDVNNCPEGLNSLLSPPSALCTGVTTFTNQPQYFSCSGGYKKNQPFFDATGDAKNLLSPITCN